MRALLQPIVLMSAFQTKDNWLENSMAHDKLLGILKTKDIPFKEVDGKYAGVMESSVVISSDYESDVALICDLFNQESCLYLDQDRNATLVFQDNKRQAIGIWEATSEADALRLDNYTYAEALNQYFTVVAA